jgi:hypothetical protein
MKTESGYSMVVDESGYIILKNPSNVHFEIPINDLIDLILCLPEEGYGHSVRIGVEQHENRKRNNG